MSHSWQDDFWGWVGCMNQKPSNQTVTLLVHLDLPPQNLRSPFFLQRYGPTSAELLIPQMRWRNFQEHKTPGKGRSSSSENGSSQGEEGTARCQSILANKDIYTTGRITWNLRIRAHWKRKAIFQSIIFRFYVSLRGVSSLQQTAKALEN